MADGWWSARMIAPGGPAEKAGLERGDVIVGVGGVASADAAGFLPQGLGQGQAPAAPSFRSTSRWPTASRAGSRCSR